MIIGRYAASMIAHYNVFNKAAMCLDCMLGEPQGPSLSHSDIYNPGVQVYRCSSAQLYACALVHLCTGVQVCVHVHRCTSAQVYKYIGVQIQRCTSTQAYKCISVHVYMCTR